MSWWWLGPLIGILVICVLVGFPLSMHEMNPDPGWRAREAKIRRLQQERSLRDLEEDR